MENRKFPDSQTAPIQDIKADETIEIKREADDVVDVTSIDSDITHFESLTIASIEAPIVSSTIVQPAGSKKRRIEQDDEIPLDVVLRESNQQKLTRLNKSMGNMVRRRSTLDKSKTSEPSTSD